MSLSVVTLTWNLNDFLQNAVGPCTLSVTPGTTVTIAAYGQTILKVPRIRNFTGGTGSMAGIVATDNAGMNPVTFTYLISVINSVDTRQVVVPQFSTPIAYANGATQDLSALLAAVL